MSSFHHSSLSPLYPCRFEGSLNTDLNEITTNLVPFPRLHFLLSSLAPLHTLADVDAPLRDLDHAFTAAFSRKNQLMRVDPRQGVLLACGLLVRGDVLVSDVNRNIERLRPSLHLPRWNQDGFKVCKVAAHSIQSLFIQSVWHEVCTLNIWNFHTLRVEN